MHSHKRSSRHGVDRRAFLRVAPAGLLTGVVPARASAQSSPASLAETLERASSLADLDFSDAERELMRAAVARNRQRYRELRSVEIGADVEPAFHFQPDLPGRRPTGGATPHASIPYERATPSPVPPSLEDLAFAPVTRLATLIERRELTSTALTEMYLARLKRYGDRLQCVVTLTEALARVQAADADREIAGGRYRGPLHGIPWGAKDLLATRGIRTTWGARPYVDQVIDNDATVVRRLHDAGAVLVAKLAMGALARGSVWFGGSTRNPWDLSRSASGSSAGPGAATAAGLVGFAIGTETLGSIISPSAACGVVGLRPTYGRVSRHGAMALSWTMDKIGPMCRTVEDCAIVLNAIYGPDGRDASVADAPFRWDPDVDPARLRVGYLADELDEPPVGASGERQTTWTRRRPTLRAALDVLRDAGVTLEPITLPDFPVDALRIILNAESAAAFDDVTRDRGVDEMTRQSADAWPNSFRSARFIPAVEYLRAQRARTLLIERMDALFATYDIVVSPTQSASLTVTNLTGHPALAVKAGFVDGLPVGLMMTGRLYEEAAVLAFARAFEQRTPWRTRHPQL